MNICECCKKEFVPSGLSKNMAHRQRFCSKACSNRTVKRRTKKISLCFYCNSPVSFYRSKFCDKCKSEGRHYFPNGKLPIELTIGELFVGIKGDANKCNRIRYYARQTYINSNKPKKCFNCGYDKHFEVCHKNAIANFDISTNLAVVNSKENLIALCPNCHWELDNGLLKL